MVSRANCTVVALVASQEYASVVALHPWSQKWWKVKYVNNEAEYEAKVARATQQVKEHAKRKRKGKLGQPDDGLWPHGMVWVAYFLTGFFCLCCGWYTVLLALSFGPETTAKWLGGFISTLIYQSVIQDPCKIGLVILFMDSAEFWLELYYEFMEYLPFDISFMMEE